MEEEIQSIREVRGRRADVITMDEVYKIRSDVDYDAIKDYASEFQEHIDYRGYEDLAKTYAEQQSPQDDEPDTHIITEAEFCENDNYDKETLYLYADDILVYENEEIVIDVDGPVGEINLVVLQDPDESVVYIRNEAMSVDYEVIKLSQTYSETVAGVGGSDGDDN